jgi:hypothetical protein
MTSASSDARAPTAIHLGGHPSRGHWSPGARREPVRGAAQGEPGRTRKGERADDDAAPASRASAPHPPGAAEAGSRQRPAASGHRQPVTGERLSGNRRAAARQRGSAAARQPVTGDRQPATGARQSVRGDPITGAGS